MEIKEYRIRIDGDSHEYPVRGHHIYDALSILYSHYGERIERSKFLTIIESGATTHMPVTKELLRMIDR